MLNLLISHDAESWSTSPHEFDKSRVAVEYTTDEISERYKALDENAIRELQSFPTLFVTEGESTDSRIGFITNIKVRSKSVIIHFEFDPVLPVLPAGSIEKLRIELDLGQWELSRTHWAIKDEDLLEILIRHGYIATDQAASSSVFGEHFSPLPGPPSQQATDTLNSHQVFIVHGHDELAKLDMANFISALGLEPIILHLQASSGRTIIEKIEAYSNVGFAVVLYTPCDVGAKKGDLSFVPRARQNVVFEHGYLIAKLGRDRVTALVKGHVETPNDISGVVYISLDAQENWKSELIKEMKSVGYERPQSKPGDLVGEYRASGNNGDGTPYEGKVLISRLGDNYQVTWRIGEDHFQAEGFLKGDRFRVTGDFDFEYKVRPDDTLVGEWEPGAIEKLIRIPPNFNW